MHHFLTRYLSFQRFAITPSFASVTLATGILPTSTNYSLNNTNRTMCKESIPKVDDACMALPSSMTGPPVAALVPPGQCQFGTEWTTVPLLARFPVSSTSSVLRFGLPNGELPLQLSTCACILANATIDGEDVVRPYTPISTNADIGTFDLLVKNYGPTAKMSRHMHEIVPVHENGDNGSGADATDSSSSIRFKHIEFNVKIQAPFDQYQHVYMLVGGTGITPMIQALHAILGDANSRTKVTMLYGSKVSTDILGCELLHKWAADHADRFQVIDVLSHEPTAEEGSDWKGERGFVNRQRIEEHFLPANTTDGKLIIFVCGPPPMYNALCGPREEKEVTGVLGEMGYSTEQVFKF